MNSTSYSSSLGALPPESSNQQVPMSGTERQDNTPGKRIHAMYASVRQRVKLRWLAGFMAVFAVLVAMAWWGLDMGQAPLPKQSPAPVLELGSDVQLSPDAPLSANDAVPAVASESAAVGQDRISDLLAAGHTRARSGVTNGKRRYTVEFLTEKDTVTDVYTREDLSREGWKLAVSSDRRTAVLSKGDKAHTIPVVSSSSNSGSQRKNRSAKNSKRGKSNMPPLGDHEGVPYMKQMKQR